MEGDGNISPTGLGSRVLGEEDNLADIVVKWNNGEETSYHGFVVGSCYTDTTHRKPYRAVSVSSGGALNTVCRDSAAFSWDDANIDIGQRGSVSGSLDNTAGARPHG